jgi:F0F1-type ATP synthase delta subunit
VKEREGSFCISVFLSPLSLPPPRLALLARCSTQVLQEVCSHVNYTAGTVTVQYQLPSKVFSILTKKMKEILNQKIQILRKNKECLSTA